MFELAMCFKYHINMLCFLLLESSLQCYCLCHVTTESYGQHLEAALFEGDVDYAKVIVKKLVEAKMNQRDFSVAFLPAGGRSFFK